MALTQWLQWHFLLHLPRDKVTTIAFGNRYFFLHPEGSCCWQPPPLWDFCFEWHCLPWLVQGSPLSWFGTAANVTNGSKAQRSWHIIFSSDANYLRDLCHCDFNFLCLTDLINSLKHVYKHNTIRVLGFRCQIML